MFNKLRTLLISKLEKKGSRDITGFTCPVCLYPNLEEPYVDGSYNICPSCGIEFGYDDSTPLGIEAQTTIHQELRQQWIKEGCKWFSQAIKKPTWWLPS